MKQLYKNLKVSAYVIGSLVIAVSVLFGYQDTPLDDLKEKYAKYPSTFTSIDGMEVHFRDEGDLAVSIPIVLIMALVQVYILLMIGAIT